MFVPRHQKCQTAARKDSVLLRGAARPSHAAATMGSSSVVPGRGCGEGENPAVLPSARGRWDADIGQRG